MKDTIITDNIVVLNDTLTQITHLINLNESSGDNSQLISNLITILIALAAALIALYQVKSNIISNSRIIWIENLRTALSEYIAEVINCANILQNMYDCRLKDSGSEKEEALERYYSSYAESSTKIDKLGNRARLYLNSDETDHMKIEEIILNIDKHFHKDKLSDIDKARIEKNVNDIVNTSKLIFKTEWTKTKKIFKM